MEGHLDLPGSLLLHAREAPHGRVLVDLLPARQAAFLGVPGGEDREADEFQEGWPGGAGGDLLQKGGEAGQDALGAGLAEFRGQLRGCDLSVADAGGGFSAISPS